MTDVDSYGEVEAGFCVMIRVAPNGARVEIELPGEFGEAVWSGVTRISGGRIQRDFHTTLVGQYRLISQKLMPGASERVFRQKGYDVVLYEAADRSDSCLVWVGPYHEATTWFGTAAPRPDVITSLINLIRYEDSASGARIGSSAPRITQQYGTMLTAWSEWAWLCIRPAEEASAVLPDWQGLKRGDQEIWRGDRGLEDDRLAGTAYRAVAFSRRGALNRDFVG